MVPATGSVITSTFTSMRRHGLVLTVLFLPQEILNTWLDKAPTVAGATTLILFGIVQTALVGPWIFWIVRERERGMGMAAWRSMWVRRLPTLFLGALCTTLIVGLGLLALILPGVYFYFLYSGVPVLLLADSSLGVGAAFHASGRKARARRDEFLLWVVLPTIALFFFGLGLNSVARAELIRWLVVTPVSAAGHAFASCLLIHFFTRSSDI